MKAPKKPDIIEGILARDRVHLIAGPSGVGKTTFMAQMIECIQGGSPFFGFPTHQVPILYITADRTREEHKEACERLRVPMEEMGVRIVAITDKKEMPLLYEVLDEHARENYLVIVEPLPFFVVDSLNRPGNINDNTQVARFLTAIKGRCYRGKYTLLGSCHAPKSKDGNDYAVMRERIAGTSAWGAYTATNICFELMDPQKLDSPFRTAHFILRNARSFSKSLQFNEIGRLETSQPGKTMAWDDLDKELEKWPIDDEFAYGQLVIWAELVGTSLATAKRWMDEKLQAGEVHRIERGIYRRNRLLAN